MVGVALISAFLGEAATEVVGTTVLHELSHFDMAQALLNAQRVRLVTHTPLPGQEAEQALEAASRGAGLPEGALCIPTTVREPRQGLEPRIHVAQQIEKLIGHDTCGAFGTEAAVQHIADSQNPPDHDTEPLQRLGPHPEGEMRALPRLPALAQDLQEQRVFDEPKLLELSLQSSM